MVLLANSKWFQTYPANQGIKTVGMDPDFSFFSGSKPSLTYKGLRQFPAYSKILCVPNLPWHMSTDQAKHCFARAQDESYARVGLRRLVALLAAMLVPNLPWHTRDEHGSNKALPCPCARQQLCSRSCTTELIRVVVMLQTFTWLRQVQPPFQRGKPIDPTLKPYFCISVFLYLIFSLILYKKRSQACT